MAIIQKVIKDSVASKLHLKVGDELVAFDEYPLKDVLDFIFYESKERFTMTILRDGKKKVYKVVKNSEKEIGLELDSSLDIEPIRCKNKCKFCFVDQLPKGMRETLYVKDDDYRLSFISGNFITLSNVMAEELARIVRLKLSPLYVSVHATDEKMKHKLIANPEGAKTLEKLKFLAVNKITMHAQIVFCKDENDGDIFLKTINDLILLRPQIKTVAVVPVGLTKHREGLYHLKEIDEETALTAIKVIEDANKQCGGEFIWASDEFYLKAKLPLPNYDKYGDFDQIENGVGLVATFSNEVSMALSDLKTENKKNKVSAITGVSFGGILKEELKKINKIFVNVEIEVLVVENNFFGKSITVAGLITGGDIIKQCKGKVFDKIIIPSNMLREFTDTFLDGITVSELEKELNSKVYVCSGGEELVNIICELQ